MAQSRFLSPARFFGRSLQFIFPAEPFVRTTVSSFERNQYKLGNQMSTASQRMKDSQQESEALAEQVETLRKDISDLTRTVSRLAKAGVSDAQDAVREKADEARDVARRSAGDVEAAVRDNPLQAALIAAGIGFAIGIMARR